MDDDERDRLLDSLKQAMVDNRNERLVARGSDRQFYQGVQYGLSTAKRLVEGF